MFININRLIIRFSASSVALIALLLTHRKSSDEDASHALMADSYFYIKDAFSGLRQLLATEGPLKMIKNSSFCSQDI